MNVPGRGAFPRRARPGSTKPPRRRSRGPVTKRQTLTAGEPQVGIEPTTARLRIECSTPELLWRGEDPTCCKPTSTNMPWRGLEPRRLTAPPPQDGVSTNFTTRANPASEEGERMEDETSFILHPSTFILKTGATGLEPATSRVTVECSNQTELRPQLQLPVLHLLPTPPARASSPNGNRTRLCTLKGCRPNR